MCGKGIGAQEICTPGPGDLLQEHETTWHWVLVISRTGHQRQLEHSEMLRHQLSVEDRHVVLFPIRLNIEEIV